MELGMLVNAIVQGLIQAFMSAWLETIWPAAQAVVDSGAI